MNKLLWTHLCPSKTGKEAKKKLFSVSYSFHSFKNIIRQLFKGLCSSCSGKQTPKIVNRPSLLYNASVHLTSLLYKAAQQQCQFNVLFPMLYGGNCLFSFFHIVLFYHSSGKSGITYLLFNYFNQMFPSNGFLCTLETYKVINGVWLVFKEILEQEQVDRHMLFDP